MKNPLNPVIGRLQLAMYMMLFGRRPALPYADPRDPCEYLEWEDTDDLGQRDPGTPTGSAREGS